MSNYHGYQSYPINFRSKRKYFLHSLLDITSYPTIIYQLPLTNYHKTDYMVQYAQQKE